jgi:hypothetical protein
MISILNNQPTPNPETARQVLLTIQALDQFGTQFNLFSLISTMPLLSPPSLLAQHAPGIVSPMGGRTIVSVTNMLSLTSWGAVLVPTGLFLGFIYLNLLARSVQAMRPEKEETPVSGKQGGQETIIGQRRRFPGCNAALKLARIMLFSTGLLATGIVFLMIWAIFLMITREINEFLFIIVWGFSIGIIGFGLLHLFFVVHGVLLGERGLFRAVLESIALIRANLPSSISLVLIAVLIYQGLGFIWSLPSGDSWLLLVGILGNSCIATALMTGTFVFYQERVNLLVGKIPPTNA